MSRKARHSDVEFTKATTPPSHSRISHSRIINPKYSELIFDNHLGTDFEAWEFGEGTERKTLVWNGKENTLFKH